MSSSFVSLLQNRLTKHYESGLRRELSTTPQNLIDFASNDYLGLARSVQLADQIRNEYDAVKPGNGSTGSRLLTGNFRYTEDTEQYLAKIFKAESGLICNSGYTANLAVLSAIPHKGDTILYDELAHASIKDGSRLSLATRFSFRHNDPEDLEMKIRKAKGNVFIVIESIYSMDGDRSPMNEICSIARGHNCFIILDEAHSTGMYAKNGAGLSVMENLQDDIAIRIYTFGKATGVHGAFIAGKKELTEYLINFSRPFIYTTAPSPHSVISIRRAFEFIHENPELWHCLQQRIADYQRTVVNFAGATHNDTSIQTLIVPGNENARAAARQIRGFGFDVRPILSPTVPRGKERLRICLHAFNTEEQISELSDALRKLESMRLTI